MPYFYHVTRSNIENISEFALGVWDGYIAAGGLYSADEFKEQKLKSYPNGISQHGVNYLHHPCTKDAEMGLHFSHYIENTFELIRRLNFPDRTSRFLCSFGCLTVEDALKLRIENFQNFGIIYKVSCESFFVADMNLLKTGSIIGMEIMANKYWKGNASANPFWEVLMDTPVTIVEQIFV